MGEPVCMCPQRKGNAVEQLVNHDEHMPNPLLAHVIKFGNLELYSFKRAGSLCIPLDSVMQTIGTAANKALLDYVTTFNVKLHPLDSTEVLLLQHKCGFNENISCLDLISIEDFQNFCKKFTSSNISNPVIVEFALNSPCAQSCCEPAICLKCCLPNDNRYLNMNDDVTWSDNMVVNKNTSENESDLIDLSIGYISIGNTRMDAFTLKDNNIYVSFKDIVACNVLQLSAIQKGMRELHLRPITAPTEINDHLKNSNKLSYNTFWLNVETVHNLIVMLKKRKKRNAIDPSLVPCFAKRLYKYYSVAMVSCRQMAHLTVQSFAVDSKSIELVPVNAGDSTCEMQTEEPFVIMDKRANARKLALHQNCAGCSSKVNTIKAASGEVTGQELYYDFECSPDNKCSVKKTSLERRARKAESVKKNKPEFVTADQSGMLDDLRSALALEPGDYIVRDYDQFCELFKSTGVVESNTRSSHTPFAIDNEDQFAVKFIENEAECVSDDIVNGNKDENNNLLSEAMEMCGIIETGCRDSSLGNVGCEGEQMFSSQLWDSGNINQPTYLEMDTVKHVPDTKEDDLHISDAQDNVLDLTVSSHVADSAIKAKKTDKEAKLMEESIKKYLVFSREKDVFRFEKFKKGANTAFPALFWPTSDHPDTVRYRRSFIKASEAYMGEWFKKKPHKNAGLKSSKQTGMKSRQRQITRKMSDSDEAGPISTTGKITLDNSKSPKRVGRPKVRAKLCEAVDTSKASIVDSGCKNPKNKNKKRKLKECSAAEGNKKITGRGRNKCRRKRQRCNSEDRSFEESFRIEIFETKQKPKIMLRNWKNFSELGQLPQRREVGMYVKGELKRFDTMEHVTGNVSANRFTLPFSVSAQDCLTESAPISTDQTASQSYMYVAPMKIKREAGRYWKIDGTCSNVANADCFVRLTRMKWLDKLSRKYDFP